MLGGTSITLTHELSSTVKNKGEHHYGIGQWTYTTILGCENRNTTLINIYRPGKTSVEVVEINAVIKQHWLILQPGRVPDLVKIRCAIFKNHQK